MPLEHGVSSSGSKGVSGALVLYHPHRRRPTSGDQAWEVRVVERTLTMIKPDAVENGNAGRILARFEDEGFRVVAGRFTRLTEMQAREFYAVHRERPFFESLVAYMTSGPIWAICLERDDAVAKLRDVMGATNPEDANEGTIRKELGSSIERNAVHGSDSPENARIEIGFFFSGSELV